MSVHLPHPHFSYIKVSVVILLVFFILPGAISAQTGVRNLNILINAYPDLGMTATVDPAVNDYLIQFTHPETGKTYQFYWCCGAMLPAEELENADSWWTLFYTYDNKLRDPADMTDEEQDALKEFTSRQNRRSEAGTPMFFFDAVYSSFSQKDIEPLIVSTTFLGKRTRVHQRVLEPLKRVEAKILEACKTDESLQIFVDGLKSCDAYHWRLIEGTNRKSFHALGIAVDMEPKRYTGEAFWSWARDHNPDGWMLTPLRRRWMPHQKVIEAFESEGFIWGGYWAIWDNMHFEYHPELIGTLQTQ